MVFINVRELSKLIESAESRSGLEEKVAEFTEKYSIKILLEEYETLIELAIKINKREKGKSSDPKRKSAPAAEVFTYGELKVFSWTLFLYCFTRGLALPHLKQPDFEFFARIFKQKTETFIEYEINCLIWSREKYIREWEEPELEIFQAITSSKATEEWKSISFALFCQSGRRYFRPFHQCRERWINHSNPSVKRGDWTLEEDVELFSLVVQLGCRWALLSRELKGTRSEHSIKNRYNSVVKSMRKQYKITSTTEVEQKILKYLKFRLNRKTKPALSQEDSDAELNLSSDSKDSRERSREVKLQENEQNRSAISSEPEAPLHTRTALFDGIFDVDMHLANPIDDEEQPVDNKILNLYISDETPEEKKMKRTWEEEYEVIDGQISIGNAFLASRDNWWLGEDHSKALFTDDCDYRFLAQDPALEIQPIMREIPDLPLQHPSHYDKMMSDDWLFDGQWSGLDE